MSEANHEDEDFKLPLRPWLKNHIDKKTFEGLEWVDAKKQIFKIPWTKKNHPGWEKHYEVFKSWAKHRGRLGAEQVDYNKLKGNFRSVLHKSEDFKELKDRSKTDQQSGNYRVFQILPSSAVKENRKRTRPKSEEPAASPAISKQKKPSDQPPAASEQPQSLERDISQQATIQGCVPESSQSCGDLLLSLDPLSSSFAMTYPNDITSNLSLATETSFSTLMDDNLPTIPLQEIQQFLSADIQNCVSPVAVAPHNIVPPGVDNCIGFDPLVSVVDVEVDAPFEQADQEPSLGLLQFLEKANLSKNELTKFMLTVYYGEKIVVCQERVDLLRGLRVLYGDSASQLNAVSANGKIITDFKAKSFELPQFERNYSHIADILKFAKLGVVLSATSDGTLYAKRLCQSRVYCLKEKTHPFKLERKAKVEIFSYLKYIENLRDNAGALSDGKIELFLGEKPPIPTINVVKFLLQPVLAPHIEYFFAKKRNVASSLCYSEEPSSVDKMITLFTNQSIVD